MSRRRFRRFMFVRHYYYDTHNEKKEKISDISSEGWKSKVINETIEEMKSLGACKTITFMFHDRDRDEHGDLKKLHVHIIVEFINALSYDNVFEKSNSLSRHFDNLRNKSAGYRYLLHITEESLRDKKTIYPVQKLKVFDCSVDSFLKGEDLEFFYRDAVVPSRLKKKEVFNLNYYLNEVIYEIRQGQILETSEIEEFLLDCLIRDLGDKKVKDDIDDYKKQIYKFSVDNRAKIDLAYKDKVNVLFENMRDGSKILNRKNIYLSGSSGLGKSYLSQDLARYINLKEGLSVKSVYDAPAPKKNGSYDFLGGDYKGQNVTLFQDVGPDVFGFEFFLGTFDPSFVSPVSSRYYNKKYVSIYSIFTYKMDLKYWAEEIAKSSNQYFENKSQAIKQVLRRFSVNVEISDDCVIVEKICLCDKDNSLIKEKVGEFCFKSICEFHNNEKLRNEILSCIFETCDN